jgi:hypothetical protein
VEVMTILLKRPPNPQTNEMSFSVNTMHKRKAQKIYLVDDLGQRTREVEGRLDWKQRVKRRQVPNADSELAPFKEYFEPRYANFLRGTRLTPNRLSEMKISTDL